MGRGGNSLQPTEDVPMQYESAPQNPLPFIIEFVLNELEQEESERMRIYEANERTLRKIAQEFAVSKERRRIAYLAQLILDPPRDASFFLRLQYSVKSRIAHIYAHFV